MTRTPIEAPPCPELVERVAAALVVLARYNIPTDIQELLVGGNPSRNVAPGALAAAIEATVDEEREALKELERAATFTYNAAPEDREHWSALCVAIDKARAALAKSRTGVTVHE
jgi:hypothetical protein